jgi:phospholipid/cholesterol/gamma-HCH transport system substrate-binding protein
MEASTSQKFKTGLFTAIGFAILLIAIFYIGKAKNLFGNTFNLYANFKTVNGLQSGNFVRFAGINVGTVDDIIIVNDTTVRVNITLQNRVKPYMKQDATASIGGDGLMGDKLLQINPGINPQLLKENSQIASVNPMDMDKLMAKVSSIASSADSLAIGLTSVVGKINRGEGSLGKLLNDKSLVNKLENSLDATTNTVKSIKKGADGFSDNMEAAKSNFLLKGFFKKKEKKRIADSIAAAKKKADLKSSKKN